MIDLVSRWAESVGLPPSCYEARIAPVAAYNQAGGRPRTNDSFIEYPAIFDRK